MAQTETKGSTFHTYYPYKSDLDFYICIVTLFFESNLTCLLTLRRPEPLESNHRRSVQL